MNKSEIPEKVKFDAINYAFKSTDTRCGAAYHCEACPKSRHCDVYSRYEAYIAGYREKIDIIDNSYDNLLLHQLSSMNFMI